MERIRKGVLDPRAEVEVSRKTLVAVGVDGKNGFGFVAAERGSMFFYFSYFLGFVILPFIHTLIGVAVLKKKK